MRFDGATILRGSTKSLLVTHPDLPRDTWFPRQALHVLSPVGAFFQPVHPTRGSVVVEPWFTTNPDLAFAVARRARKAAREQADAQAAAARTLGAVRPQITFSADQEVEITKVLAAMAGPRPEKGPLVLLLNGPAGSGKTTVAAEIVRRALKQGLITAAQYAALTGRAAKRIADATGSTARTLHSLLFRSIVEAEDTGAVTFKEPQSPVTGGGLLVVDEASMIGKADPAEAADKSKVEKEMHDLLLEAMPAGSVLLYLGDSFQLEPITGIWGPDFDRPTGSLSTVHRQGAGSPVLTLATALRTTGRWPTNLEPPTTEEDPAALFVHPAAAIDLATWYVERRKAGKDVAMVAYTNALRHGLNSLARELLGHSDRGPLVVGDRLMIRKNAHDLGLMNGQIVNVSKVEMIDGAAALAGAMGLTEAEAAEADDPVLGARFYRVSVAEKPDPNWFLLVPEHLLSSDAQDWWIWGRTVRRSFKQGRQPRPDDFDPKDYDGNEEKAYNAFLRALQRHKLAVLWLERAVPVNYGECLTGFSAQGSQWRHVGVAVCGTLRKIKRGQDAERARLGDYLTPADDLRLRKFTRWVYTAVTRASHEVCVFNLSDYSGEPE